MPELEEHGTRELSFAIGGIGMPEDVNRQFPVGAEVVGDSVSFRVWAPRRKRVLAVFESPARSDEISLSPEADGYFSGTTRHARAGMRYRFRLDDDDRLYPDPASRFQPEGPHGPSEIVDASAFEWTDSAWRGVSRKGQVVYELHVGTFTPAGTWSAAATKLPLLADIGVTVVELMPVADFSGEFGWGYDGVNWFAPTRLYGSPDDFRRFVDQAHALGLGVILDVVYNHFGPDGNYIGAFSRDYFTDRHQTDWGEAINFDDDGSGPVREFVEANAAYWVREFHLDGLRVDATQNVYDDSSPHILQRITDAVRKGAGERRTFVVAENEFQHVRHVRPASEGGFGMDSLWNDDLHHSAVVALTGHSEAYYTDYRGSPQEFISAVKWGYLYQGQWYKWQQRRRGTPSFKVDPECFVAFLENHDQIANTGRGQRLHQQSNPAAYRALTALVLLAPSTPMLFQGQEFAATSPFFYFASHPPELSKLVAKGRREFLTQFPSLASEDMQRMLPDPAEKSTFERSKLDWSDRERNHEAVALHRDLLRLRREDPVFAAQTRNVDGAVLSAMAFVLRFFADDDVDRLLLVNLGNDAHLVPGPEPFLAPPEDHEWRTIWSSEHPRYGGHGTPPLEKDKHWFLPGHATVVLRAVPSVTS
jgi:maltooligosyltrehalose trehalohydrolase